MENIILKIKSNWNLTAIYASNLLLAFHYFLIIYINSSFLEESFSPSKIGTLYIVGSVVNLLILINASKLLRRFGNYKLITSFIILEFIAISGLAWVGFQDVSSPTIIALLFIIHQAILMMILFNLDIFLEEASVDEGKTGGVRGVYLTLANAALVVSPAIAGLIMTDDEFWRVYLISSLILIPLFLIVFKNFKSFRDYPSINTKIFDIFLAFWRNKNIYYIFMSHLLLQFFYAFMIIYIPILLREHVGFSWSEIGLLFTIMLVPFVIFEIPVGKIADKKLGEKEILITGFVIMTLSTGALAFLTTSNFLIWAILLFLTRVGASFAEITTESYFFKHVNASNADMISFFRITRPLSFILAPIVATVSLFFVSQSNLQYSFLFFVLGILMIWGIRYGVTLTDTK